TALSLLKEHAGLIASYPATAGRQELRAAIAKWLEQRFSLSAVDPDRQVLPLNGTREGLFALAQAAVTYGKPGAVISPNPFYQIYEGAALLAGTEPLWVNCNESNGFLPDFDAVTPEQWQACELLYICTPGNPAGAVMPAEMLQKL
ncbi:MAG: aminotransferase class I/II-fold pyridoxal phosphate-dependent enzyme, partial [Halieaceae bacterium]